jgi:UDP-N-acetylmuramyl pentapeptide phosphotransferase/UDP-N-acetylglucosamine-1-phosphate transferase
VTVLVVAPAIAGITLVLSLLLPFAVKPLLVKLHIMDTPNERSSHERPMLRGLGLAVLLAMAVGYGLAFLLLGPGSVDGLAIGLVAGAAVLSGLLGLGEDLNGVSVGVRSVLLLLIALGLVWYAGAAWWIVVYAVLFVSGYINVANFMDGLNGISGFHGVIAGLAFAAAGGFAGLPWLIVAGLVLAAGFAGFLPWNLTKPGAFLGDVGSYLLGGATAATSLFALMSGVPILATIGPMIIYFGDVAVTLAKRVRAGHKWDEPHKEHVYQRLQQMGFSHVQASGIAALFTAAASALGLASFFVSPIWWLALLVAGLAVLVVYLALPRLLGER